jgi:predicted DNA-binding transcriptional regulator AlpA
MDATAIALALGAVDPSTHTDPAAPEVVVKDAAPDGVKTGDRAPASTPEKSLAAPRAPPGRVLLTREQVLIKCGCSDATLRRRMASGLLPRPVVLGNRYCLRWFADEVEGAIAGLVRQEKWGAP